MAYLDQIQTTPQLIQGPGRPLTIGNTWPEWEVSTPQWPVPNVYNLVTKFYKGDELVYACVEYRSNSISEPPAKIYTGKGKTKKEVGGIFDTFPNGQPNEEMGEVEFWKATETYRSIAGFAVWEKERNRRGEVIALWPLNPMYCSMMRDYNHPIRAVRYQYPGLQPYDILRKDVVIFQEFDPQWPFIRSWGRLAASSRSVDVHSATTSFLSLFFKKGAVVQGILTTDQPLTPQDADNLKAQWMAKHGGYEHWNEPAVLGQGTSYAATAMNFKDMAFPELDGRTETSICMDFGISPLLLAAKVGLSAVTDTNFVHALEQYYQMTAKPSWRWYQSELTQQLLPDLTTPVGAYVEFDTSGVSALQDDEDALWTRWTGAAEKNLVTRDDWRSAVGLDPIDGGNKVFVGVSIRTIDPAAEEARVTNPDLTDAEIQTKVEADTAASQAMTQKIDGQGMSTDNGSPFGQADTSATADQMKRWRDMAVKNVSYPIGCPFDLELIDCTTKSQTRAVFEKHWPARAMVIDNEAESHVLARSISEATKALLDMPSQTPAPAYMPLSLSIPSEFDVAPLQQSIADSELRTSAKMEDLQNMVLTTVQEINGKVTPITINVPMEEAIATMQGAITAAIEKASANAPVVNNVLPASDNEPAAPAPQVVIAPAPPVAYQIERDQHGRPLRLVPVEA